MHTTMKNALVFLLLCMPRSALSRIGESPIPRKQKTYRFRDEDDQRFWTRYFGGRLKQHMLMSMTDEPTQQPTLEPTNLPTTAHPTSSPSARPSSQPSMSPSNIPSAAPSATPTTAPSTVPTGLPSMPPTLTPTNAPAALPTSSPTKLPSTSPSTEPSTNPSALPTNSPTAVPSASPSISPSTSPTTLPSTEPSIIASVEPSRTPTSNPSLSPTVNPTSTQTVTPSSKPSAAPTNAASAIPTASPSSSPTTSPSTSPSIRPTSDPSESPTMSNSPTAVPSTKTPTASPTTSNSPTNVPTSRQTISYVPTASPTSECRPECQFIRGTLTERDESNRINGRIRRTDDTSTCENNKENPGQFGNIIRNYEVFGPFCNPESDEVCVTVTWNFGTCISQGDVQVHPVAYTMFNTSDISEGYLGDNGPSQTPEFSFNLAGSSNFFMVFQQVFPGLDGVGCSFQFQVNFGFCNQQAISKESSIFPIVNEKGFGMNTDTTIIGDSPPS